MCNDYERELAASQAIQYMEEMKHTPSFAWAGGRIPNDADLPQPHIRIHDKGFTLRLAEGQLEGDMTKWAWDQGSRPVYNFKSDGRDFSGSERCLILATAFYEYTEPAPTKPKIKLKDQHRFTMRGEDFFWIAGIIKQGCFAMLTTEPGPDVKPYHDRQIVTLAPSAGLDWLTLARPETELLRALPKGALIHRITRENGVEKAQ
jgi:putative SOS response-associated peptidase YedK